MTYLYQREILTQQYIQYFQTIYQNMISMFTELIHNALRNQDNNVRSQAESDILKIRDQDTKTFFQLCGELLGGQQYDEFMRQSSATLLSRSIILKNQNNCFYWDIIPPQIKQKVKQSALSTLMNQNISIVKSGANVISSIVFVEVPRGQWKQIIDILAENTQNDQFAAKNASIITIGFICQQFHFAYAQLDYRVCQQLLGGILVGIRTKDSPQIVENSLSALRNSISFLKNLLEDGNIRGPVFNAFLDNIGNADYTQVVYQGLFQFCKVCYDFLGQYINQIKDFIIGHIQQRNQMTILALQLIDTIGTQFLDRVQEHKTRFRAEGNLNNYLLSLQTTLLPEVMRCLLIQNKNDLDFPQMRNSANKTLGTLVNCGNRQSADTIINGVAQLVKSDNVGQQQASAILLSSLCQYPQDDIDYARDFVNSAFQPVIQLIESNEQIVVSNTLVGFITIGDRFPQLFLTRDSTPQIFDKLFQIYLMSNQNIKESLLSLFQSITNNLPQNCILLTNINIFLSKIVKQYQNTLKNYYGNNINFAGRQSSIIINFLIKINNRETIKQLIQFLIEKLYEFNDQKSPIANKISNADKQMISLSIFSVINTALLALQRFIPIEQLMHRLCQVVESHIKKYGLDGDILDVIGAMVVCFKQAFYHKSKEYWVYVRHGMEMIDNQKCFTASLKCIGDYSRTYHQSFKQNSQEIIRILFGLIHQNIQRQIKLTVISTISDIFLSLGATTYKYLDEAINICELCFTAVYQLAPIPSQKQYVEQLKGILIQFYACLIFALLGTQSNYHSRQTIQKFSGHFKSVVQFIVRTCDQEFSPPLQYLKNAIYVLSDELGFLCSYNELFPMLRQIVNSPEVMNLVGVAKNLEEKMGANQLCSNLNNTIHQINSAYMRHN